MSKLKLEIKSTQVVLETILNLSESVPYASTPKEISIISLMYMTGYFCRSVYISIKSYVVVIIRHGNDSNKYQKHVSKKLLWRLSTTIIKANFLSLDVQQLLLKL